MLVGLAHLLIRYCGTADTAQRKRAPTAASPMPGDPKECRQHALNCVHLAQTAATPRSREHFANLAQTWVRLAEDLERAQGFLNALDEETEPIKAAE